MTTAFHPSRVLLALSEDPNGQSQAAAWIGPLLALGTRAARFVDSHPNQQLITVLSVPRRDFAAALIGCGWVMAAKAPVPTDPMETFRSIARGTPIRAVNDHEIITGLFWSLDESTTPPRVHLAGSTWLADRFQAVSVLPELDAPERAPRPEPGSLGRLAHLDEDWAARLAGPATDLAIVGTVSWLKDDFEALLNRHGDGMTPTAIRDLLLPDTVRQATWSTRVYPSARLTESLPLPSDLRSVILDGAAAIKHVEDIEAPALICILDRSVVDETAAEILLQLRNSRGEPVSIQDDLGWCAPVGVEALAFTVPL